MQQFKTAESTAARRRFFIHLVDDTDGKTPETGETSGQPQVAKNGGSFNNTSATLVHMGNGCYYVELTTNEIDTLGYIVVRYKSANTREFQDQGQIVAYDPYLATTLGLSNLAVLASAIPEITGPLSATPTLQELLTQQVAILRNAIKATNNDIKLHNDAGVAKVIILISDDGTTFTRYKQTTP